MTSIIKKLINPTSKKDYVVSFLLVSIIASSVAIGVDGLAYFTFGLTSVGTWYNKYWLAFFFVCTFVPLSVFLLRNHLCDKPEKLYLIIILCTSLLFSWSTGVSTYSWDDGIHYRNTLILNDFDESVEFSTAESEQINTDRQNNETIIKNIYDREFELNYFSNDVAQIINVDKESISFLYPKIAYLPSAIIMCLCDFFGLSFSATFVLSKMAIALCYSLITYFGMKKLITGKMLYAIIALLPTAVFLASNYSYDWWVNAFVLYAFATLAGIIQDDSRKISVLQALTIPLLVIVGSLPKLVYAPLAILCILIPKERFKTKRDTIIFRSVVLGIPIILAIALIIYLAINPNFISSILGAGDTRGGSNVNSSAQLEYILSNPLSYLQSIITFLMPPIGHDAIGNTISGMLSPGGLKEVFTHYAYLGILPKYYCAAIMALLLFTILTDKKREIFYKRGTWIFPLIIVTIILIAIISALYLSFTGVGSHEIHGVQGRYLIPLLFPLFIWLGTSRLAIANKSETTMAIYNGSILTIMFIILMSSWWIMYIAYIY